VFAKMSVFGEPVVLFGMCGCEDEFSEDTEFYKDINKIRNSYNYFNDCCESYEELMSYSRAYKKNWNETQFGYLKELEEIYREEHKCELSKIFVSLSVMFGILDENGKIMGFIMLAKTLDIMLVVEIFVKEEYRGQGIGKKLFDYVLNLYKTIPFTLHVSVLNVVAINMYLKYDFVIVDEVKNYYKDIGKEPYTEEGVNAYHMIKFVK
jgi:ribosomal protein S18 acetylase RimI-like enzyme